MNAAVYEAQTPILNEMSQRIENRFYSIRDDSMKINQNLTEQTINARYICGGSEGWRRAIYLDNERPQHHLSLWLKHDWIATPTELVVELMIDRILVTQSSSLSAEDHTVRCVVGSEPTSVGTRGLLWV